MPLGVLKHVGDLRKDAEPPSLGASVGRCPRAGGTLCSGRQEGAGRRLAPVGEAREGLAKPGEERELGCIVP